MLASKSSPCPPSASPTASRMSSRNVYLSPEEREAALALPRALALARRLVMDEGMTDAEAVAAQAIRHAVETPRRGVTEPRLALDYVSVSDEQTLEELDTSTVPPSSSSPPASAPPASSTTRSSFPKGIRSPTPARARGGRLRSPMQAPSALNHPPSRRC